MTVLMNYRRLFLDILNYFDQLINDNYLVDLNFHFRDCLFENSERVTEQMMFALLRILYSLASKYESFISFLETTLDRERSLLHLFDEFIDYYFRLRISYQSHKTVKLTLSIVKMSKFEGDDDSN